MPFFGHHPLNFQRWKFSPHGPSRLCDAFGHEHTPQTSAHVFHSTHKGITTMTDDTTALSAQIDSLTAALEAKKGQRLAEKPSWPSFPPANARLKWQRCFQPWAASPTRRPTPVPPTNSGFRLLPASPSACYRLFLSSSGSYLLSYRPITLAPDHTRGILNVLTQGNCLRTMPSPSAARAT